MTGIEERKRITTDLSTYTFGKIPPQAKEIEIAVLGAVMLESGAAPVAMGILTAEMFYVNAHRLMWLAIEKLFAKSEAIDMLTVTEQLRKDGKLEDAGGAWEVTQMSERVASAANVEYHARILREKYLAREVIRTSSENIKEAYEDTTDIYTLVDTVQQKAFALTERQNESNEQPMTRVIGKVLELADNPQETPGLPSGWKNLDRLTPGFLPGENIVIAARPGMGKTAFVLQMARMMSERSPVAFFSLEMQASELAKRMLASESGVPLDNIIRNRLSEDMRLKLKLASEKLRGCHIIIDDTASQRPLQILGAARKLKSQHDICAIFIDYMQLMDAYDSTRKFSNRNDEVTYLSQNMKRLAKTVGVPVFVLSQLSRNCEERSNKRPMLSDLRDSGSIEQDADKVLFLYRDDYYGIKENDKKQDVRGLCEVIIAKQRNGALDTALLNFDGKHQRFSDR